MPEDAKPEQVPMRHHYAPFRNLTSREWQNLAIAGLMTFYAIQIVLDVAWGNIFSHLNIDFASFWSAGFIANRFGYSQVYELGLMQKVQAQLWPKTAAAASGFQVVPTPYLPVFLIPFQVLSLIRPVWASWVWMVLNVLGIVFYLRYFVLKVSGRLPEFRLLALMMVSVPVFLNVFTGQADLWLLICVGQYMLAALADRRLVSGLWLGGLLLKPQCLVLIVPALLIEGAIRSLAGLTLSGLAIVLGSWILAGTDGLLSLGRLWIGYAGGIATNDPQLMMNWRMIGVTLERWAGTPLAWSAAIVGLICTGAAALYVWSKLWDSKRHPSPIAITGLFAATGLVAWHSHVHMAMILIAPLLYMHLRHPTALGHGLEWWIFLPGSVYIGRLLLASLMHAQVLPFSGAALDFLAGTGLFGVNIYLLAWAVRQARTQEPLAPATG